MIMSETENPVNSQDQENLQVVFLRKELALKISELDEAEKVAQSLTTQLQAHLEQIAYYKEHSNTQQKLIRELETSRDQLAMQIQVGSLLDFAVPEIKNLRGTLEERTNYIYSLEAERDNLQRILIRKDEELQQLSRSQLALQEQRKELEAAIAIKEDKLVELEAAKNQMVEIIEQQEAELKKYDLELATAINEGKRDLQTQTAQVEQLQSQLARLQMMLSSRDEYVAHLEKENAVLAQTLTRFETDLRSLQATLTVRASRVVGKVSRLFRSK